MSNTILPTLYKHSNNKLRIWDIKVEKISTKVYIITEYGSEGGKVTTSKKEVPRGKGKNSIVEQGILDATSKWTAKKKKGGFSESKKPTNIFITPMLAHTFKPDTFHTTRGKNIRFPAYAQRKYDGIRCISNKSKMISRNQTEYSHLEHITNDLQSFLQNKDNDFYIDGELYTDEFPFEVLSGLINTKYVNDENINDIQKIEYHIYDCFNTNDMSLTYEQRLQELNSLFENIPNNISLKLVVTDLLQSVDEVIPIHNQYVEEGYEGIILRNIDSPYEFKRSKNLQKYKSFLDDEFKIIGFKEGTGTEKGTVIWECELPNGKTFSVRPKGSFEMRKQLLKNGNKYIGHMLTVHFQNYSNLGIPRFPVGKALRYDN
jgi:ATP-dependent DNA ligase